MRTVGAIVFILAGLGVYWTQGAIDSRLGPFRTTEEALYLPSGKAIAKLSLGHSGLLADIYWMRAVQYYGEKRLRNDQQFDLLERLIDIATTLDPQLLHAYRFGSIFLSERPPVGAGHPEEAVRLLKKGIDNNPEQWQLYRDLGFTYYWYLEDYKTAASWFLKGSENPHSASWMKSFAAELLAKGGSRESARFLWQELYDGSDNEQMRNNAKENLLRIQALDEIDFLKGLIARLQERLGRKINSLSELVSLGVLKQIPLDPKRFPYSYNPHSGDVGLSPDSTIRRF